MANSTVTIERKSAILPTDELMAVVRAHAKANGQKWGWDLLSKVPDDKLRAVVAKTYTKKGAITRVWQTLIKSGYEARPVTNGADGTFRAKLVNGVLVK